MPVPGGVHYRPVPRRVLQRGRVHPPPAAVLREVHGHELPSEVADAQREVLPVADVLPGLAERDVEHAKLEPGRAVEGAEHPHGDVGARAPHGRLDVRVQLRAADVATADRCPSLGVLRQVDPVLPVVAPAAREVGPLAVDLLAHGVAPSSFPVQRRPVLEVPGDGRRQVHLFRVEEDRWPVVLDHGVKLLQRRHRRQIELDVIQAREALLAQRGAAAHHGAAEGPGADALL